MKQLLKTTLLITFCVVNITMNAQNSREAIQILEQQTDAKVTINENFGIAEFVKFQLERPLTLQGNTVQVKTTSFLTEHKAIYNLNSIEDSFENFDVKTDNYGLKNVELKQLYKGVPVFDAVLKFHYNRENKLTAINGNFVPNIKLNEVPSLNRSEANTIALREIDNQNINYSGVSLQVISSDLYVFQKGMVQGYFGGNFLVYRIEVRNDVDVREFLFINAHDGSLVEQFTGMAHALDRIVYENNTSNTVWQEGDAFPGSLDQWQQNEVETSGHMYHFFNNAFGYVSYDGADAQMVTINNDPNISCPNAQWTGSVTRYCSGTATDDIIAHEWAHAYTQYTNNLVYAWQSGAMNESYSDIWGETIDLLNGYEDGGENLSLRTSCGSSDRWMQGEDASGFGGAIRDMWDPTCKGDPGKVTDGQYWCSTTDGGGVHTNSGIPNHAYALLVDGGTYNGQTISGLGFTKAAHIFWRAQSVYLTSTSDFNALADALDAACADLVGINLEGLSTTITPAGLSGEIITADDCNQVANALLAVELRLNPDDCSLFGDILAANTDPLCEAATSNNVFFEDWESGIDGWTFENIPVNAGTWTARNWHIPSRDPLPDGRPGNGIYGPDPINGDCAGDLENGIIRLQSPLITIPDETGKYELSFNHYVFTEQSWDGGNLKYNLDNSGWLIIPSSAFTINPYNSSLQTVAAGNDNPMAGEAAFTGGNLTPNGSSSGSWGQSTIDLSLLNVNANSTIQFRWEMGTDGCNGADGWYLDEIFVYNCAASLSVNNYDQMIDGVTIYPNPTQGVVTVKKTNDIQLIKVELFDLNGRILKSQSLSDMQTEKNIDIINLASGVYFVKVTSDNSTGVMRLIKE